MLQNELKMYLDFILGMQISPNNVLKGINGLQKVKITKIESVLIKMKPKLSKKRV